MKSTIGAILLAAGDSKRMGRCKFLLPLDNGLTFFENIIQTFSNFGINTLVVVTQAKYVNKLKDLCNVLKTKPTFVVNHFPEFERFHSLQLGIKALGNVKYCFVHNADSPFIDVATLELLAMNRDRADTVRPVVNNKGGHPILVNESALKHLLNSPRNSNLKDELETKSRWNVAVENELITVDIDTPEEYKKYFK